MTVMVIGGGGAMAIGAIKELVQNPDINKIILVDQDEKKLEKVIQVFPNSKTEALVMDIKDTKKLINAMQGVNGVCNCAWYELNIPIMNACVDAGCHYVDLGGLYHVTFKQLQLKEAFEKAKVTAVLGIGASPGLVNVAIAKGAKRMDTVKEVHIRTGAKGGKGFAYSAKTILDEVSMRPMIFTGGRIISVEPLSGRERYLLPDPVGEVEGFYSIHSELATIPYNYAGIEEVTFRVAFSPRLLNIVDTLISLGLLSEEEFSFKGMKVSPRTFIETYFSTQKEAEFEPEWKSFRVEVIGEKNGNYIKYAYETVVESDVENKIKATALWTGIPAAVAVWLLVKGNYKAGVFPPELAFDPDTFLNEMTKRKIVINERLIVS